MSVSSPEQIRRAWESVRDTLKSRRGEHGHWEGKLSTSALSTATAVMALEQVRRHIAGHQPGDGIVLPPPTAGSSHFLWQHLIDGGLKWLAEHQNADGGWGDTVKSVSNISTTMLAYASFLAARKSKEEYADTLRSAGNYINVNGGVDAVIARYGKDKTFSVPILTHCALAGMVSWDKVSSLPFELSCIPAKFYAAVQLPVVSYALPALIAIGQVKHHYKRSRNYLLAQLRDICIEPSLRVLDRIQPSFGGFLEATPLTSFVVMSLAAKELADHPVVIRGTQFIVASVLPDGSWPIDTNLATWVTTLSVNALAGDFNSDEKKQIRDWLLGQQYLQVHPFTNAAPGGWAWTDLPGGVPDADDTPGAMLALLNLIDGKIDKATRDALTRGANWLRQLQNRDGGWPTFCKGWGTLPFDRSSCDITAHCVRALFLCKQHVTLGKGAELAIKRGLRFLEKQQASDGSWMPLWFGNQHAPDDINPVYGTSKVLAAYRDLGQMDSSIAQAGCRWLKSVQNPDGGWGGTSHCPSSVEETALAVEILRSDVHSEDAVNAGIHWLVDQVERGKITEAAPIGFYFAKLWYFEELYPLIFAANALRPHSKQGPSE